MYTAEFDFVSASSVQHALELRRAQGRETAFISGGHTLLPAMKNRLARPELLVDISRIPELSGIDLSETTLKIGATTTHAALSAHAGLQKRLPIMHEAAEQIADNQVRSKGTIGGSVANADPAADWPAVILALNSRVHIVGVDGARVVPATDFFKGLFQTALAEGELIKSFEITLPNPDAGMVYLKHRHPASGYAVTGVAAIIVKQNGKVTDCSIGITGAGLCAIRATKAEDALVGTAGTAADIAKAAALMSDGLDLLGDAYATKAYRQNLAKVMGQRAMTEALARASRQWKA